MSLDPEITLVQDRPNLRTSDSCGKLVPALVAALAKIEAARKGAENLHLKNRYADLASVLEAARPPLAEHGLAILQPASTVREDGQWIVVVTTTILHESGEWIESTLRIPSIDARAQAIGSAMTYGRRYSLTSMLGMRAEDDDGNAASGTTGTKMSKAEREELAAKRVAEIQAQGEAPIKKAPKNFKMLEAFGSVKKELTRIGHEAEYYRILSEFGFEHCSDISDKDIAAVIYRRLCDRANDIKIEQQSKEIA